MSDQLVILFGRSTDIKEDIEDALGSAWCIDEWSDDGWWDRIEVIAADGTTRVIARQSPEFVEYSEAQEAEQRAKRQANPPRPHVANVMIDGKYVLQSYYGDDGVEQAEADCDKLRPFLGDRADVCRVKVWVRPHARRAN